MEELRRLYINALSDDELALLASAIQSRQFGKGEVLMHEGDEGDRFYILRKGKVEIFAHGKGGEPTKHLRDLDESAKDNFIGEIALLTGARRNATVRATTDLEVWEIGRDAFARLFRARPEAGASIAEVAGRRATETSRRLRPPRGPMLLLPIRKPSGVPRLSCSRCDGFSTFSSSDYFGAVVLAPSVSVAPT